VDVDEDVGSYRLTLRKREDTGNWKRKHQIMRCGELVVEGAMDLSWDRIRNEWM